MSILYAADLHYVNPLLYSTWDMQQDVDGFETAWTVAAPWSDAAPHAAHTSLSHTTVLALAITSALPFGDAAVQAHLHDSLGFRTRGRHDGSTALAWADYQVHASHLTTLLHGALGEHTRSQGLPFGEFAQRLSALNSVPFGAPAPHWDCTGVPWGTYAAHALTTSAVWRSFAARGAFVAMPWSPIAARSSRTIIDWVVDPDPGDDPITVPIFPVYVMLPTLQVVRLPDRTPIPVLSVSLQGELGSWAWTFTAPMARAGLALIDDGTGTPTEIEVTVNGHVWTFMVDGYDDNRRFNSNTCTLRGRSRSAALAEPHAARRTYTEPDARDASQLADQELAGSGWTLVWDAPDWLVPGGTFSYQDLAPLDAIAAVANSIGAAVMSDPAAKELRVAPAYPESPWAWGTAAPFAVIPASILTEGSSSWVGGVNANGVYVYAQNSASGALVKVAGTDGAAQLPMVVDPLAVHADAQRERGRAELAANGIKRRMQRTVPLFPPPPEGDEEAIALAVLPLGALVEFQEADETWRGQVMGVRIDAQRAGRALSVRQHLTVERQYR